MSKSEPDERIEQPLLAYSEVLDATKHQDDKIGRLVAAIAFFVAGVLAFVDSSVLKVRYTMDSNPVPLVQYSVGMFLVLAALSAILFVLSTTQPLRWEPRSTMTDPDPEPGLRSHLFFIPIAETSRQAWRDSWSSDEVAKHIRANLVDETHVIAVRATQKYRRSTEAASLLLAAMPAFAMTVVFALDTLADPLDSATLPWNGPRRLLAGLTLGSFAAIILYFHDSRRRSAQSGESKTNRPGRLAILTFYPTLVLLTVTTNSIPLKCATVGVGAIVLWSVWNVFGIFKTIEIFDTKSKINSEEAALPVTGILVFLCCLGAVGATAIGSQIAQLVLAALLTSTLALSTLIQGVLVVYGPILKMVRGAVKTSALEDPMPDT